MLLFRFWRNESLLAAAAAATGARSIVLRIGDRISRKNIGAGQNLGAKSTGPTTCLRRIERRGLVALACAAIESGNRPMWRGQALFGRHFLRPTSKWEHTEATALLAKIPLEMARQSRSTLSINDIMFNKCYWIHWKEGCSFWWHRCILKGASHTTCHMGTWDGYWWGCHRQKLCLFIHYYNCLGFPDCVLLPGWTTVASDLRDCHESLRNCSQLFSYPLHFYIWQLITLFWHIIGGFFQ